MIKKKSLLLTFDQIKSGAEPQTCKNNKINQLEHFIIENFQQLDDFISKYKDNKKEAIAEKIFLSSYSVNLNSFMLLFGSTQNTNDPFSNEYAKWEMAFFEFLAGRKYSFSNEGLFSEEFFPLQHPLSTLSVDEHTSLLASFRRFLMYLGDIKGKRILEMGCGFGKLATLLESSGCDYYAVDASMNLVEITKKQMYSDKIKSQIVNKSFYDVPEFDQMFDIIIFDASFHHCAEPVRLLKLLYDYTSSDARLIFLKEPIADWFERPWGIVRSDGETILQIRMRGWLELGYRTDFFNDLLNKTGWELKETETFLFEGTKSFIAMKNNIRRSKKGSQTKQIGH
jgi:2-polyprenyl-3-methyl-5-hydroxy-6-metoxy-1,4-benzoquinol methylase